MEKTPMQQQIESVPQLMELLSPQLREKAERVVIDRRMVQATALVLVGCGDSYCAALAAKPFLQEVTGRDIEVATAIEIARTRSGRSLLRHEATVYIFISNSGTVSRIVEAAKRVAQLGGHTLAVTGNDRSPLFAVADIGITMEVPKLCGGPGLRSYTASMLALFALGVALSRSAGEIESALAIRCWDKLLELPSVLKSYLDPWEKQAQELARTLQHSSSYECIGCGADYANAFFAVAKVLETAGRTAGAINTEDWLHMNYFVKDVHGTATLQFIDRHCGSYSRAKELERVAREMERPLLVYTNEEAPAAGEVVRLPDVGESLLACFIGYLPASMLMGCLGVELGETDFRGTRDHWTACIDFATVAASEQIILP